MENIGVLLHVSHETNFREYFREAKAMGLSSCQICVWDPTLYTDEKAEEICNAVKEENFSVSLLWAGYTGPRTWNFTDGPDTIGLVPVAYRAQRLNELIAASDFALKIGVTDIATHVGFIPENPGDPNYPGLVAALRYLCKILKSRGQYFLFETGQETPTTLLRTIETIGLDNLGINFDTANLLLYGRGNSADAVRVFGRYVRNTHIKDGFYPTSGTYLGKEAKVGEGLCDLPEVVRLLRECGYKGPWTIEREITGEQQKKDIVDTVAYLHKVLGDL